MNECECEKTTHTHISLRRLLCKHVTISGQSVSTSERQTHKHTSVHSFIDSFTKSIIITSSAPAAVAALLCALSEMISSGQRQQLLNFLTVATLAFSHIVWRHFAEKYHHHLILLLLSPTQRSHSFSRFHCPPLITSSSTGPRVSSKANCSSSSRSRWTLVLIRFW